MKWLAYAGDAYRRQTAAAASALAPGSAVSWQESPEALREALLQAMPGQFGALVGPGPGGAASINLAAALVQDAHASEVVLAHPDPSGSLRSRAAQAGIARVVTLDSPRDAAGAETCPSCDGGTSAAPGPAPAAERSAAFADDLDEVDIVPARPRVPHPKVPDALPCIEMEAVRGPNPCPVLCIASGRGGVGKTAIAATMAATAARWGLKTALVDFDLACGNCYAFFGMPGPASLDAIGESGIADERTIAAAGKVASSGVSLWGPCERPENAELVSPQAGNLVSRVCAVSDLVIVDTSTAWSDAVAQAAQMCDRLLLVCPEQAGHASSLSRIGGLAVRLGVARTRIVRIANFSSPKRSSASFINRADVGLEAARTLRVTDGGEEAGELLLGGHVTELAGQDSEFVRTAAGALAQILQELGRLPDCNEARRALGERGREGRRGLFGRRKEAV